MDADGSRRVSGVEDVKTFAKMLEETRAIVEKSVKAGNTLDQLKSEKVLAAYDKWSGDFISTDRFVETLYNDVTSRPESGGSKRHH